MTFEFTPAKRANLPLLILLAGGTGSGKTESAMRLATGLAAGKPFAVVDTEVSMGRDGELRGRALHKADDYQFEWAPLDEPYTPERYAEAVAAADEAGFPVVVIDSGSHEYEGPGGVLDMQAAEFERMGSRDSARMASWIEPKRRHKAFVQRLLRSQAHVIMCLRSEDKVEVAKVDGRTVIRPKQSLIGADGWIPICEKRLPFEATVSLLLLQTKPGVPVPIKLERRHAELIPLDQPLDEETGRRLGEWAAGDTGEVAEREAELRALAEQAGKSAEVDKALKTARKPDWYRRQIRRLEEALAEGGGPPTSTDASAKTSSGASPSASDDESEPDAESQFRIPVGARQQDQG